MTAVPSISFRPLAAGDLQAACRLAQQSGVHGVYVHNSLLRPEPATADADLLGFFDDRDLTGVAFFGRRGNLIALEHASLEPAIVARAIAQSRHTWRIALGSRALVLALAQRESVTPLVLRRQVYYGVKRGDPQPAADPEFAWRAATRQDVRALVRAALELNKSDLNVEPWRVNKGWLRDSVRRRVRSGRTYVVGPPGAISSKADIGSHGPGGTIIEGVYTVEAQRGHGLATRLVTAVTAEYLQRGPLVCLHVAADNAPARRAYERAGMRLMGECWLLLRG